MNRREQIGMKEQDLRFVKKIWKEIGNRWWIREEGLLLLSLLWWDEIGNWKFAKSFEICEEKWFFSFKIWRRDGMGQTWTILAVGLDRYCSWKCTSVYRGCDVDRSITARVKRDGAREVDKWQLHNYNTYTEYNFIYVGLIAYFTPYLF
jgi:hypothetical protein